MSREALDDADRAIIELLQADGRMPFTKVAAAVGLTEGAIRQRVQRLTDAGVMQIVAVTDPLSLGVRRVAMVGRAGERRRRAHRRLTSRRCRRSST